MKNILVVGDVIKIEKGMEIKAKIPKKFIYENKRFSNELDEHKIIVGETYTNECDNNEILNKTVEDIIHTFDFRTGLKVNKEEIEKFVKSIIKQDDDVLNTNDYMGEYLVIESKLAGGGYVRPNEYIPDEPFVVCKQLIDGKYDKNSKEISFYLSWNNVEPIRKMEMSFK